MAWSAPADRGNKVVRDKGLGHQSAGSAGQVVSVRAIDPDVRAAIASMLARGLHRDQIAAKTGAPLQIVRIVEAMRGNL